mmetsp:Transcript_44807/g.129605  ORF Transcript_44807/g.129605 Transcript_44807/m.129605 type:complete len:219 (+) Transcript_44807:223-879(+)
MHSSPGRLEQRKNVLHKGLLRDGACWVGIASRVVWPFAHLDVLDNAVVDNKHKALAPGVAESMLWPGMVHAHADGLRELAPRVRQESDDRAFHALILRPSLHHSTVVDAVDQHLIDALLLQLSLLAQIARDLHRGSAGREGAWQTQNDHLLALRALGHVDLPNGIEAVINGDRRDRIPGCDHSRRYGRRGPLGSHGCCRQTEHSSSTQCWIQNCLSQT